MTIKPIPTAWIVFKYSKSRIKYRDGPLEVTLVSGFGAAMDELRAVPGKALDHIDHLADLVGHA